MQIRQTDPDLESLARRLLNNEIDLQPEFQRQEVWSRSKKQKLIDTILRGWAVPPVHLIVGEFVDEVLDGQQRLTAIRDFYNGDFTIDASIRPHSTSIIPLDGLTYKQLPERYRRSVDRYGLRVYRIFEANPQEAAELFYRLNQPTALTSGEQRNALYGERRNQMKLLVRKMSDCDFQASTIGFSNTRLAYDDVIARSLVVLSDGTLRKKISEARISDEFREEGTFPEAVYQNLSNAIGHISTFFKISSFRFNKASLFTILVFCCRKQPYHRGLLKFLLESFGGKMRLYSGTTKSYQPYSTCLKTAPRAESQIYLQS
ncbi:DUF262 domain-containing protein [Methylorubrum extorquens]|uniref:DUF262 domain-containing protein n=1 Tax=Methylorubrum extorquens TaxID=408 RepID=UPI000B142898|nr:DUF262 domain-containing protein [Methylorubrum extorquens]WIU40506.1 DUF262 domain-containing protein [Methylorubrum extorquens]